MLSEEGLGFSVVLCSLLSLCALLYAETKKSKYSPCSVGVYGTSIRYFIIKTYTVHWNLPLLYFKSVYLWSAMLVHEVKWKINQLFKSLNSLLPSPRREGSAGICALSHHSHHSDRKWCHMEAQICRFAPWYMTTPVVMSDLWLIVWLNQLFLWVI